MPLRAAQAIASRGGVKAAMTLRRSLQGKKLPSYKKGGKVKKTGPALLHKGERVLNKKQTKKYDQKKFDKTRKKVFNLS